MTTINNKISNDSKETAVDSTENKCIRTNPTHSCEVMIDFRTCLCPPPKKNTKVKQCVKVNAKIEKICAGKVIIGGTLHKTITYTAITHDGFPCKTCTKHKDIPFSCYIDIDCGNSKDKFEIVDCETICSFSEVINTTVNCCKKAILVEKDIVKIIVKRIYSSKDIKKCKFCGKAVVDSEICFAPAVNPAKASVSVSIDPDNFKVDLVCCDLIVVCGFITKTVAFTDDTPTAKKDILVQINVPANIDGLDDVDPEKWTVTRAEVCTGCFNFTCPSGDADLFHKLVEKDIIAVLVENKH